MSFIDKIILNSLHSLLLILKPDYHIFLIAVLIHHPIFSMRFQHCLKELDKTEITKLAIPDCWKTDRDERPSFQELVERLEELMLQEVDYFDFNKVDESKDYYQVPESKTEESRDDGNDEFDTFI